MVGPLPTPCLTDIHLTTFAIQNQGACCLMSDWTRLDFDFGYGVDIFTVRKSAGGRGIMS